MAMSICRTLCVLVFAICWPNFCTPVDPLNFLDSPTMTNFLAELKNSLWIAMLPCFIWLWLLHQKWWHVSTSVIWIPLINILTRLIPLTIPLLWLQFSPVGKSRQASSSHHQIVIWICFWFRKTNTKTTMLSNEEATHFFRSGLGLFFRSVVQSVVPDWVYRSCLVLVVQSWAP